MRPTTDGEATGRPVAWVVETHEASGGEVIVDEYGEEVAQVFHGSGRRIVRAVNAHAGLVGVVKAAADLDLAIGEIQRMAMAVLAANKLDEDDDA